MIIEDKQTRLKQTGPSKTERKLSMRSIRSLGFNLIYAMEQFDYEVSIESIIDNFKNGFDVNIPKDSFAIVIAKGVIEDRDELDKKMAPLLKNWEIERLGLCTRLILRMALWEFSQPDAIPSVVINEAVELAKSFAEKDAYKFVNGILDAFIKRDVNDPEDQKE